MGDRLVHGAHFDVEGRLVDYEVEPEVAPKKRVYSKRRRRGQHVFFWTLLLTAAAGFSLWSLATSVNNTADRQWGIVQVGELRSAIIAAHGAPCHQGNAVGTNAQTADRGARYMVWPNGRLWELVIVGHNAASTNAGERRGYFVIDQFTALKSPRGINYCARGVTADPFEGKPWFIAQ